MSLRNCKICFDKPVYFAGETVTGKVELVLEKNKACEALMLNVLGKALCRWSERHGTGKHRRTVYYHGNEIYFTTFNNLMAAQHMQVGTSDLTAGNHSFNFAFVLPHNLPSSIEGHYGNVRYSATVTLKRQFKINLDYKVLFTVLSFIDLNVQIDTHLPIHMDLSKKFFFLFLRKGTLAMTVKIPFAGYVSGQYIPISFQIKNDSKIKINSVKAELIMNVLYRATYPHTKYRQETKKHARDAGGEINGGEEKSFNLYLYVPAAPSSTLNFSTIVNVSHIMKITAVVSGMHGNLSRVAPVVIGTIPLAHNISDQSTSGSSEVTPTAPPSYEEVVVEKRMEEEEGDECDDAKTFSPQYPVYHFEDIKK